MGGGTAAAAASSTGSSSGGKKRPSSSPPRKPGEMLTPTQRRNARKRRAKRQQRAQAQPSSKKRTKPEEDGGTTTDGPSKRRRAASSTGAADPSLRHAANPRGAPLVRAARQFFRSSLGVQFPVHCGATAGWRTVAKLAVRRTDDSDSSGRLLSIGLFAPGTHRLLPCADGCPAHHPAVNRAVARVEQEARRLRNVTAYDEATGAGRLRYVVAAVQRHTGRVQLTLVWNTRTAGCSREAATGGAVSDNNNDIGKDDLSMAEQLCRALLLARNDETASSGEDPQQQQQQQQQVEWHSIWVHGNASGKHSNAIVSPAGAWRRLHPAATQEVNGDGGGGGKTTGMLTEYLTFPKEASKKKKRQQNDDEDDDNDNFPIPLHFPPQVFRQANLDAFAAVVGAIRAHVRTKFAANETRSKETASAQPRLRLLELYGGVGTIGLHAAAALSSSSSSNANCSLVCSDENPHNRACFEASARAVLLAQQANKTRAKAKAKLSLRYESRSAAEMVRAGALRAADCVIVDPPRRGLEASVSAALADVRSHRVQLLVYVSCGFAAFRRDCDVLVRRGGWRVERAEGHVLFPGSDAIETLAFFVRRPVKG